MNLTDKGYYTIQEFLAEKNKKQVKTLATGMVEPRRSIREELRDEALTQKTNQIAQEYAMQTQRETEQEEER